MSDRYEQAAYNSYVDTWHELLNRNFSEIGDDVEALIAGKADADGAGTAALTNYASIDTGGETITADVVRAYGAGVGNTYSDYKISDFADIGAAVNQAVADGAQSVELPAGTFSFSTDIVPPSSFLIKGQGGFVGTEPTRLEYTGAGVAIDCSTNSANLSISDVFVRGPGSGTATFGINRPSSIYAYRVSIAAFGTGISFATKLLFGGISTCKIVQCNNGIVGSANALVVNNCRINNHDNDGFQTDGACYAVTFGGGCTFEGNGGRAINMANTGGIFSVRDCYFEHNTGGQTLRLVGASGDNHEGYIIENNYFREDSVVAQVIRLDNCVGAVLDHNHVAGLTSEAYNIRPGAVETELYGTTLVESTITDDGTRTLRNGVGENAGDPSTTGQWNAAGFEGAIVVDTTNNTKHIFRGGAWV